MFYQIFLSPQVKRCVIITYKQGMYELPYELPKNLGAYVPTQEKKDLGNIRNLEIRKCQESL